MGINTPVLASDLAPEKRKDSFMGRGFEEALKKAQQNGNDLVVGYFIPNEDWEEQ